MSNTIAGVNFDFVNGQPHAADRQLAVSVRSGGSMPVVQVTSALSPPFTVIATKMCQDADAVVSTWNALRAQVGLSAEASFDTRLGITRALLVSVGQPVVRQLAGCEPNVQATFSLVLRAHQEAHTPVQGIHGLTSTLT